MFEQLGLIGCGLMGGSFALALKKAGLVQRVVGYSKSPSTTDRARQLSVIDVEAPSALLAVAGADIVLLAVPVAATEATLKAIKHLVTPEMLIMDVGSTKADVVRAAEHALRNQVGSFVPAHPITGREVSGVEHADADLYSGRQVILTPTERTLTIQLKKAEAVWSALGSRVSSMSPEAHDAAFAVVSHLPHALAFALMNSIIDRFGEDAPTQIVDKNHFTVEATVDLSSNFYGWVFASGGKMKITAPQEAVDGFQRMLESFSER